MIGCASFMTSTAEAGCFGKWRRGYYGYGGWGHHHRYVGWGGYYSSWYPRYYYTPSYYYGGYGYGCGCWQSAATAVAMVAASRPTLSVSLVLHTPPTHRLSYSSIASTTIRSTSTTASGAMQLKTQCSCRRSRGD